MPQRLRIGILFGGRSCEHEVSVTSARSALAALDPDKYDITLIGVGKDGRWHRVEDRWLESDHTTVDDSVNQVWLDYQNPGSSLAPSHEGAFKAPAPIAAASDALDVDVFLPLLHGPFGEDGTVQGLLELAGRPYVGSGVLGSAVAMDKSMMKRVFAAEALPILDYRVFSSREVNQNGSRVRERCLEALGMPLFVKPANLGSSVGVHRVDNIDEFVDKAIDSASYDTKIIVEPGLVGCRELECGVLGNDDPQASIVGEIVTHADFYHYAAKYVDDSAELLIPAPLEADSKARIRELSIRAFNAVGASGLSRVDFFMSQDGEIILNEINTMPGFTPISMYPKLWQASGVAYAELIDTLIDLAISRHRERSSVRTVL